MRIKTLHKFVTKEEKPIILGSISLDIRDNKIEEVMAKVDGFMKEAGAKFKEYVSVVAEGHRLCIGVAVPKFEDEAADMVADNRDMIDHIQEDLKVDQNMELSLRLAASPAEMLAEEGANPFVEHLLQGVSLDLKVNVWRKIADVILKVVESGDIDSSLMPYFGGIAPFFLLRLNGSLDLEVDEAMKLKIQENPLIQPLLMDAYSLISAMSGISDEDEFEEHMAKTVNKSVGALIRIAMEHLGD